MNNKLYSIEFLRVWLTCLIIIGHTIFVPNFQYFLAGDLLNDMGSYVNIFFLIAGFFLYKTYEKNVEQNINFITTFIHRCKRLLPSLISYKILCVLFLGMSGTYLLSNLSMFNLNTGLTIPTQTHIIWFVDVMFFVYMFYISMFYVFKTKISLFATAILSYFSLCILFTKPDVNIHFESIYSFLDGGMLRGVGFMGMGVLLSAIPYKEIKFNVAGKVLVSLFEILSVIMAFLFLRFNSINSGIVFNYILWCVLFVFLASRQYGLFFRFLNRQSWINYISKYCYEMYVFQLFAIILGYKWFSPHSAPLLTGIGIIILSFVFGKLFKDYVEPLIFKSIKKLG